jgi:hypothetical protein
VETAQIFAHGPVDLSRDMKELIEGDDDYDKVVVRLSDLVPTQRTVNMSRVTDALDSKSPVRVWDDGGVLKLVDGHHRAALRLLNGAGTIPAHVCRRAVTAAAAPATDANPGETCPPATLDIQLNLKNRQNAIDTVGYGPLNPAEPNEEFWQDKADRWNTTPEETKKSVCGNCVFFDRRPQTLQCIETGLAEGGSGDESAWGSIDQAELGYCTALDFKCAASRTCNAWAAGGPVTAAASKPAPKKDRVKGSKTNKPGSAKTGSKVKFSARTEATLRDKLEKHNEKAPTGRRATMAQLKAVYRRGAGAFSSSHRPGMGRDQWAMARVNAYLRLLRSGRPANKNYTQDNDLLPASHPRSTKGDLQTLAASGLIPEEQALADALLDVVSRYGKFDQDGDGVWAGYTPASENEVADIGVKCANCVFFNGDNGCAVISLEVEAEGKCRFAVLPEGAVQGYQIPLRDSNDLELLVASAYAEEQLNVRLLREDEYDSPEHALLAMAELSGLGYEVIPALRAAWLRGVRDRENPFDRAAVLASALDRSQDSDLLPTTPRNTDEKGHAL